MASDLGGAAPAATTTPRALERRVLRPAATPEVFAVGVFASNGPLAATAAEPTGAPVAVAPTQMPVPVATPELVSMPVLHHAEAEPMGPLTVDSVLPTAIPIPATGASSGTTTVTLSV